MRELNITDVRQYWAYRDLAKAWKYKFGKMQGLWRCLHLLCELMDMFEALETQEMAPLGALLVQAIKCLHQVGIDHGDWSTAQWLLPIPDPSGRSEFGGDEDELTWIHAYKKSIKELRSKMAWQDEGDDSKADADAKGRGKGKDKDKDKDR